MDSKEKDMYEFFKERGADEKTINKMKEEKIDEHVLLKMDDNDLKTYIPAHGDRIAIFAFCKKKHATPDETTRSGLCERIKSKMESRGKRPLNCNSSTGDAGGAISSRKKADRRIELGWMHYDKSTMTYKQVRSPLGGGTRHLIVPSETTKREIIEMGKNLFFLNGFSQKGEISEFDFSVRDFQLLEIDESTIMYLYEQHKVKLLRLYLCTREKETSTDYKPETGGSKCAPDVNSMPSTSMDSITVQSSPSIQSEDIDRGEAQIDTGTPTIIFNTQSRLNLRRNLMLEIQENAVEPHPDPLIDVIDVTDTMDGDDGDEGLQSALEATMVTETGSLTFDTIIKKWTGATLLDAGEVSIVVHRRKIWESTKRAISRVGFSYFRPIQVEFAGECGEDQGGPKREYFRLLMKAIKDKLLEGTPERMTFQHNIRSLEQGDYKLAGQFLGWSLLHGGPTLPVFHPALVQFLAEQSDIKLYIDDVDNEEVREAILKIRDDEDVSSVTEWAVSQGLPPLYNLTTERRTKILDLAIKNYVYYRISVEIAQFRDGLNSVGSLADLLKCHFDKMRALFIKSGEPLTVPLLKSIMQINHSERGTNTRPMEEDTIYAFELFLQDCTEENAEVKLPDVLSFCTGADEIPPLGFEKKIEIVFVPGDGRLPVAHTCGMVIEMPLTDSPEDLQDKMIKAIQWSGGFHIH